MNNLSPQIFTKSDVTIVALGAEYESLDDSLLNSLQNQLLTTADTIVPPSMIVDLSHTKFFGSSFIEVLFRAWNRIKNRDGRFAVCGLTPYCQEVIAVTNLDRVWEIFPDQATAVTAMQKVDSAAE